MKTLIVYESREGYTHSCAKKVASLLDGSTVVIKAKDGYKEALEQYDLIIVGSAIYASRIPSSVKKFCKLRKKELLNRPFALFMCGTGEDMQQTFYEKNYDPSLLNHALQKGWFGGLIELDKHKNITRFILSKILKGEKELHQERLEAIEPFVKAILQEIK